MVLSAHDSVSPCACLPVLVVALVIVIAPLIHRFSFDLLILLRLYSALGK